ncbi:MAG: response regulator transcription factor [Myxococcales bacterium]|nr:response regulator transcription factor [Myxococcales bacterium]
MDNAGLDNLRVLLIEDDVRLAQLTAKYLAGNGVSVHCEHDGAAGLQEALKSPYDAVLLDLMLPGLDGLAVCQQLRARSDLPVLMLTARGEEADRVMGLEVGADDYIAKPFSSRELLARVRAVVRRARGRAGPASRPVRVGRLALEPGSMRATVDGEALRLTSLEFALLYALAERAGRVLGREQLLDLVHGSAEDSFDRSIDVHISRLRRKLGDDPRRPRLLLTVRGAGYMLADEGPA